MTAPQRLTRTPAIVVPSWCLRHSSSRMASTSLLALGDCAAPAPWPRTALYTERERERHTHVRAGRVTEREPKKNMEMSCLPLHTVHSWYVRVPVARLEAALDEPVLVAGGGKTPQAK